MKYPLSILFLFYFLGGILILPQGDFNILGDIHTMYNHCKNSEDKDLTAIDFITDHLMNLDCIFDQHENGDPQKPHTSIPFNYHLYQNVFIIESLDALPPGLMMPKMKYTPVWESSFHSEYQASIFRPPIFLSDYPIIRVI